MFFIKKVTATGNGKRASSIGFTKGLNIITGKSNTGKSVIFRCIDYILGAKSANVPFDVESTGYDTISVIFEKDSKNIELKRKLYSNSISIESEYDLIESGDYSVSSRTSEYEKTINSVLLKLLDINESHQIISNADYKKQLLTWRTFIHLFMINELDICSNDTPFFAGNLFAKTSILSAILFLLTGKDFNNLNTQDSLEIKKARKNAIKEYITKELIIFSEKTKQLCNEVNDDYANELERNINETLHKIESTNKTINESLDKNKHIISRINEYTNNMTEKKTLLTKYNELETQYNSDLKRLNFIVDGQVNYKSLKKTECPFCNTTISISEKTDYIGAALSDYKNITLQVSDLRMLKASLSEEITSISNSIRNLEEEKKALDNNIDEIFKPELVKLQKQLDEYKIQLEKKQELKVIQEICNTKTKFLQEQEEKKEIVQKYDPKDFLDYSFTSTYGEYIKNNLLKANDIISSIIFDNKTMDIMINGIPRNNNGKGYKAFYNSIMMISFIQYLYEKGLYKPSFLLLDSPILTLDLKESEESAPTSIKKGLFELLKNDTDEIQKIIFENKVPDIDYGNTNIIEFTHDKNFGRYGFLLDYYDD